MWIVRSYEATYCDGGRATVDVVGVIPIDEDDMAAKDVLGEVTGGRS